MTTQLQDSIKDTLSSEYHELHEHKNNKKSNKRKLGSQQQKARKSVRSEAVNAFAKPSAISQPSEHNGRTWTLSIAFPGSILSNVQTAELKTYLTGQVRRNESLNLSCTTSQRLQTF